MDRDSSPVAATFSCDLLDSVSDLFVVFDTTGEFTHWNRAVIEATGYTDEALSSLSTDDLRFHYAMGIAYGQNDSSTSEINNE